MVKNTALLGIALVLLVVPGIVRAAKVGGGDIEFNPSNAKAVRFSHDKHVQEKEMKCTNCHYHLFQMSKGSYKMDMTKMTKGDFCGLCHNGKKSFDVKDGASCGRCHK